jgi:hypothetical protein
MYRYGFHTFQTLADLLDYADWPYDVERVDYLDYPVPA